MPLLVFVKINSCATYVQTYLGLGPMVIVETVAVLFNLYYYAPKTPAILEPMLQVFHATFPFFAFNNNDLSNLYICVRILSLSSFHQSLKDEFYSILLLWTMIKNGPSMLHVILIPCIPQTEFENASWRTKLDFARELKGKLLWKFQSCQTSFCICCLYKLVRCHWILEVGYPDICIFGFL